MSVISKKSVIFLLLLINFLVLASASWYSNPITGNVGVGLTEISSCEELQSMNNALSSNYALVNDIDCNVTHDLVAWGDAYGFKPIGSLATPFTGTFDGQNFKIYNLKSTYSTSYAGLFGRVLNGQIKNVGLVNVQIESKGERVGGLAGEINGANAFVEKCFTTGTVKTTDATKMYVGGLIGAAYSPVSKSYSEAAVEGGQRVGGLIGWSQTTVSDCYATGDVTATYILGANGRSGGLIGTQNGGLAQRCYASNSVTGNEHIGGLVGTMENGAVVKDSFAASKILTIDSAYKNVGGITGWCDGSLQGTVKWSNSIGVLNNACARGGGGAVCGYTFATACDKLSSPSDFYGTDSYAGSFMLGTSFNRTDSTLPKLKGFDYDYAGVKVLNPCMDKADGAACTTANIADGQCQSQTCVAKITAVADLDKDGVADATDNCIAIPNPDQKDCNNNSVGDVCDVVPCPSATPTPTTPTTPTTEPTPTTPTPEPTPTPTTPTTTTPTPAKSNTFLWILVGLIVVVIIVIVVVYMINQTSESMPR